jgi:DNA-3-methyladenine glycosylase
MSSESELRVDPLTAARRLLGATVRVEDVALRIVEVEAYGSDPAGPWPDPAAHSYPGPTARNAVMFGPPGRLYVYLSYGMHLCANVTCGAEGTAGAVLLRAGEVFDGVETARGRRLGCRIDDRLARGPGNLGSALGIRLSDNGNAVFDRGSRVRLELGSESEFASGPRVGISVAADRPWRLWLPQSGAVSAYRRSPRAPAVGNAGKSTP